MVMHPKLKSLCLLCTFLARLNSAMAPGVLLKSGGMATGYSTLSLLSVSSNADAVGWLLPLHCRPWQNVLFVEYIWKGAPETQCIPFYWNSLFCVEERWVESSWRKVSAGAISLQGFLETIWTVPEQLCGFCWPLILRNFGPRFLPSPSLF